MRKIEDKFMVRRYGKGDTFRIYYPSSCYKSGFSINKAEQIAIRDQKGRPLSEFPMESFAMEIIVPKKIFKDAIVNEIHTKKAHLSVYIPVETDGTYIYPNKDYKSIMKAIKVAIYEHFEDECVCKHRLKNSEQLTKEQKQEIENQTQEFIASFDGFEINFNDMFCSRIDYAGFKGEKTFELVGVDFYKFNYNKKEMAPENVTRITKSVTAKKKEEKEGSKAKGEK